MIQIIRGLEEDADVIRQLISELLAELDTETSSPVVTKTELANWMRDNSYIVFIAKDRKDRKPIGVITLVETRSIYANGVFGSIQELYVKPTFRSKQIGKKLLDNAILYGREHNWKRIEVCAPDKTDWMRSYLFYVKNGFVEIGPRLKFVLTHASV